MRVLMLAWDFPSPSTDGAPRGRIAALSAALVTAGHAVTVVTRSAAAPGAALFSGAAPEFVDGVRVVRAVALSAASSVSSVSSVSSGVAALTETMAVNHLLAEAAVRTVPAEGYDVIHAHDWLVTHAAVTLKEALGVPFVASMQATEAGRRHGYLTGDASRSVHSVEWWLGSEACRVIVPTEYLRWEVQHLFDIPDDRVDVVPNGIDPDRWTATAREVLAARLRFAGEGPLLVYAGRLIAEKGVQDLLEALPAIRDRHPGTRAVVAGDGDYRAALIEEARKRKLHRAVSFPGQLDQRTLAAVLAAADAFVLPSRYEPTGTVALEAAASGAALVVASTGGLASIVEHGVTGVRFPVGEPDGLADAVNALLQDPMFAQSLATKARQMVRDRHSWQATAARTAAVYADAVASAPAFEARRQAALVGSGLPVVFVPPGNLLADPPEVPVGARPAVLLRAAAEEAAWQAGATAAREAMRSEVGLWGDAAEREAADRAEAARAASAPFDVVLAAVERR